MYLCFLAVLASGNSVGVLAIRERLGQEFPGRDLQNLYCIPEEKLKEFIQTTLDDNKIQA